MYKDLFVHLDNSPRAEMRLDIAVSLAKQSSGRVVGLFAQSEPGHGGLMVRSFLKAYQEAAPKSEAMFMAKITAAGVKGEWFMCEAGGDEAIVSRVTYGARHADIAILGQFDETYQEGGVPSDLPEQVILNSGRPVLTIPYAGEFHQFGKSILIAWNDSKECARSVNDAMPFLTAAGEVNVLSISHLKPRLSGDAHKDPEISRHLSCHGVKSTNSILLIENIGAMDMILSRLSDESHDMLVMGGHGNYTFPYLQRGAGTRYILRHMTVPVLMSH
jgi:nucleotide-binding universal stress UspA family protein